LCVCVCGVCVCVVCVCVCGVCVCVQTFTAYKRMCLVLFSFVACLALLYFSTLSHKRHEFQENITSQKMPVFIFSTIFAWVISHSKKNLERYCHKCTGHVCQILKNLEFSRQFLEIYSNMKFHQNPSSVSQVVPLGRTDMTRLIVALRKFANTP